MIFWIIQIKAYYFKIYSSFRRRKWKKSFTDHLILLAKRLFLSLAHRKNQRDIHPHQGLPLYGEDATLKIAETDDFQINTKVKSTIKGRFWFLLAAPAAMAERSEAISNTWKHRGEATRRGGEKPPLSGGGSGAS